MSQPNRQNPNANTDDHDNEYSTFYNNLYASNQEMNTRNHNSNTPRSHQGFTRNINNSQMYLLEMYNLQYNELMRQINERYQEASSIREMMNAIISTSFPNIPTPNALRPTPASFGNTRASPLSYVDSLFTNPANNIRRQQPRRTVGSQRRARNTPAFTPFANGIFSSFFDRIPVVPTSEQIRQSTRTLPFQHVENPINERCPISFEVFRANDEVLQIIHCGHIFNPCEIAVWFESNVGCPVCRFDIRDHNPPDATNRRGYDQTSEQNEERPSSSPEIMRQNASDGSMMEETKEETTFQESKEEDGNGDGDEERNTQTATNTTSTPALSRTPLIDALLYILSPMSGEVGNSELTSLIQDLADGPSSPTITFDSSYNMYYMDYEFNFGPRK